MPPRLYLAPAAIDAPAAGHCRRHRRGADRPGCARAGPISARGAAHVVGFLRETTGAGTCARGNRQGTQLTVRGGQRLLRPALSFAACREMDVRVSINHPGSASAPVCWDQIEAIPRWDWTPIPYWMDGAAETTATPSTRPSRTPRPVRLIVRRVKLTPGSQLAQGRQRQLSRLQVPTAMGRRCQLEADHRRRTVALGRERHTRPQVRRRAEPVEQASAVGALRRQRRLAATGPGPPDWRIRLARWTARIGRGRADRDHQDPQAAWSSLWWDDDHPLGRAASLCRFPRRWPREWESQFSRALARLQAIPFPA